MVTIDVHHHIVPDFFWRETNEAHGPVGGIAPPPWSPESTLAFMDDAGIDVAVTSISTPGVHTGNDRRARSLARRCNELAAGLVQAHGAREHCIVRFSAVSPNETCRRRRHEPRN
jgi:aminocarboxymuconate-semialdehyde decarboxylase